MIYFTAYANQKFEILNKHKVYLRKEEIEEIVAAPDKISRNGKNMFARKDNVEVVYKKDKNNLSIITFYPVK